MVPDSLKPLVQPIVDLTSPVVKVLIDLGYDWSGNPGDDPVPVDPSVQSDHQLAAGRSGPRQGGR